MAYAFYASLLRFVRPGSRDGQYLSFTFGIAWTLELLHSHLHIFKCDTTITHVPHPVHALRTSRLW